jgi:hypothetical protein
LRLSLSPCGGGRGRLDRDVRFHARSNTRPLPGFRRITTFAVAAHGNLICLFGTFTLERGFGIVTSAIECKPERP